MPIPDLPDRHRPSTWQQGRYLPLGEGETYRYIEGFALYVVDDEGRVWHLAHRDQRRHQRRGRQVRRQRKKAGSEGYQLRRNGCPVWLSVSSLIDLLRER